MMALRSTETQNITLKNLTLFWPKLRDSWSTNQIARFGKEHCCRIFNVNDAVDQILNEVLGQVVEDFSGLFGVKSMENVALKDSFCTHQVK